MGFDYRTYTGLGNQTLGGPKENLVHTRAQEEGAVTLQEIEPDLPVSVQESLAWVGGGLLQGWGTECGSACTGAFEEGCHYLHYFHHSLVSGQTTGRDHSPTHQQKIGFKIY